MGRDDRIKDEAAALWRELFGEQPPASVDGPMMLDAIMRDMPAISYDRLRTPHLRPTNIVLPR